MEIESLIDTKVDFGEWMIMMIIIRGDERGNIMIIIKEIKRRIEAVFIMICMKMGLNKKAEL